ncbi:MAG: deoxyribose-phosphate aldolase [Candidatus Cloacimonetes bacterium]|nr:deoxyribose-phosphate aldolase [Candidatus Cloacimonadota bacterium]
MNIREIAEEIFSLRNNTPSRSGGAHEISVGSTIDRSTMPDQLPIDFSNLAQYIDHTILKADAKTEDIIKLCKEAEEYNFYSVCINPAYVSLARKHTKKAKVCAVVGFPLGANTSRIKLEETATALTDGASEIDMVINIAKLKDKEYEYIYNEIKQISECCHSQNALLKVIIETCYLTDKEKVIACLIAKKAGADFVKTSTGFGSGGATAQDIELMRLTVGPKMGVKASGGIKTKEDVVLMLRNGANRIGTSRALEFVSASTLN